MESLGFDEKVERSRRGAEVFFSRFPILVHNYRILVDFKRELRNGDSVFRLYYADHLLANNAEAFNGLMETFCYLIERQMGKKTKLSKAKGSKVLKVAEFTLSSEDLEKIGDDSPRFSQNSALRALDKFSITDLIVDYDVVQQKAEQFRSEGREEACTCVYRVFLDRWKGFILNLTKEFLGTKEEEKLHFIGTERGELNFLVGDFNRKVIRGISPTVFSSAKEAEILPTITGIKGVRLGTKDVRALEFCYGRFPSLDSSVSGAVNESVREFYESGIIEPVLALCISEQILLESLAEIRDRARTRISQLP